jgi:transposase
MPAGTYSTDVNLTCPCPHCEGRKVRITLRNFRRLSRLPSPACEQVVHQLVSGRDNRK